MNKNKPLVLIIEDQEEIATLAAYCLRRADYQVVVAPDGLEGLRLARSLCPDLILCDACLPKLNGPELLAVLRSSQTAARIPFVLMSGLAFARGSHPMPDAFLAKPFSMKEMVQVVESLISRAQPGSLEQWDDSEQMMLNA